MEIAVRIATHDELLRYFIAGMNSFYFN